MTLVGIRRACRLSANGGQLGKAQMERKLGLRECDRCGASITSFCPSLPTLSSVGNYVKGPRDVLERKIAEAECVPLDVVREYVRHRIFLECEKVFGICPNCGQHLATRRARQCLACYASRHTDAP